MKKQLLELMIAPMNVDCCVTEGKEETDSYKVKGHRRWREQKRQRPLSFLRKDN